MIVTGATGFVGRHLTRRLSREGHSVVAVTRNAERARGVLGPAVDICEAELAGSDAQQLRDLLPRDVEAVVHLAARLDYFGSTRELRLANVASTSALLHWAVEGGVKRFVLASSIEAVGPLAAEAVPGDEQSPLAPVSRYGRSKALAEQLVLSPARGAGPVVAVLRLSNVYGPEGAAFLLPIAAAIAKGGSLARHLASVRDHTLAPVHVDDVCAAFHGVLAGDHHGVFTIAGARSVRVGEVFERVAAALGLRVPESRERGVDRLALRVRGLRHRLARRADFLDYLTAGGARRGQRVFSIDRARRELGYAPRVDFEQGIAEVLRWTREHGLLPRGVP